MSPEDMNAETMAQQLSYEIIKRWFIPIYRQDLLCSISISENETCQLIDPEFLRTVPELRYKLEI